MPSNAPATEVLGTATSGQAARTLGKEAGISEARTLASLTWRLDHHQLQLSQSSVVVLDEVGTDRRRRPAPPGRPRRSRRGKARAPRRRPPARPGRPGRSPGRPGGPPPRSPSTPSARTAASSTPENVRRWRSCGPAGSARPSTGTCKTSGCTPSQNETTPCKLLSMPGPSTLPRATRLAFTPGGGPTWPS